MLIFCQGGQNAGKSKLTVDAPPDLSIIRPTSGADETENSLRIKELDEVAARKRFGSDA